MGPRRKGARGAGLCTVRRQVRDTLPVYANINRATSPRTPAGFADAARRAVRDGFRRSKPRHGTGFPLPGSPAADIQAAVEAGIACVAAMREAVGPGVAIMLDCHSFFDIAMAVRVGERLEPHNLAWYEEPVAPERVDETLAIKRRIRQKMAGGEVLFGMTGFAPLIERQAFDVIMPDVKHCGGLLELTRIAAVAATRDVLVSPHNPSGPVSTAASVQICAVYEELPPARVAMGRGRVAAGCPQPARAFSRTARFGCPTVQVSASSSTTRSSALTRSEPASSTGP